MPAYKFSPNLASPEERRETFVAHEAILEDLLDRARKIESGARHCILIGPRGIGKTHLLLLLADSIEADETLASRWVVVRFAEEEYSITSLAELFSRVIESLPNGKSEKIGRDVDLALAHILDFSADSGKHLLLLLDNIQLYFNQFPDADIGRMRDILMSKPVFLIVGAAPSYFKQMTGYEESFYNFFEPIHLNELSPEEAEEMLCLRAEFEGAHQFLEQFDQCLPKIKAAARLTGGNPRLILMLYQVMCESGVVEASEAFKRLLDELTPYFQGRMDGLPPQARKVLDTLASMESPATPTELAEATGLSLNSMTSQLKRLKDSGFIQQAKLRRSRETRYEVTERLFRMWRDMRTEVGRTRLGFLIRFLNLWYTPTQLLDETGKLLVQLGKAQGHDKSRLLIHLHYLKEATLELSRPMNRNYIRNRQKSTEQIRAEIARRNAEGKPTRQLRSELSSRSIAPYRKNYISNCQNSTAQICREIAQRIAKGKPTSQLRRELASRSVDPHGWGDFHNTKTNYIKKEPDKVYSHTEADRLELPAAEIPPSEQLASCEEDVKANPDNAAPLAGRGLVLYSLGRYDEALESYNKAVQLQSNDAMAWSNRGLVLVNLGRYEEALESFDKAIQLKPNFALAWNNRGLALVNLGKHEEALESLKKAVELANAQNLTNIAEFAALLSTETELSTSLRDLMEDNLGSARLALKNAIDAGKQGDVEDFQLLLFGYIKGALQSGKTQFVQEAIEIIVSGLGEEYDELLRPFMIALEYMQTEDVSILERLQQEERELVLEIVEQTKG